MLARLPSPSRQRAQSGRRGHRLPRDGRSDGPRGRHWAALSAETRATSGVPCGETVRTLIWRWERTWTPWRPRTALEPVLDEEGVFRNTRRTILGADDKAAIAALLHATELLQGTGTSFPTYELFFTVSEETGLVGAKHLGEHVLASPFAAVLDSSGPVGGHHRQGSQPAGPAGHLSRPGRSCGSRARAGPKRHPGGREGDRRHASGSRRRRDQRQHRRHPRRRRLQHHPGPL